VETEEPVKWDKREKIKERGRRSWIRDKRERKTLGGVNKFCKKVSLKFGEEDSDLQNSTDK